MTIWASVLSLGLVTLLLSSYRTVYFDLEVPLLAMTVLALFACRPSAEAPHPAGAVWHGTSRPASIVLYASLGAAYFFAGVSKLEFAGLRWPQRVRLDLLQPKVMAEVHGARLVAPLRVPADVVHAVLHRQLWLGTAAGWATLLIELTFIAGLLSIRYRRSVAGDSGRSAPRRDPVRRSGIGLLADGRPGGLPRVVRPMGGPPSQR